MGLLKRFMDLQWTKEYLSKRFYMFQGLTLSPRTLRSVEVPIISSEQCKTSWPGNVDDTMVCAGSPGKDSCNGDSGGPLSQNRTVIGVVSWGSLVCEDSQPGVYARTSNPSIRDFIFEKSGI